MGGTWESLIKQVKQSLNSVTNHQVFTEEALVTILCKIESILSQRPLTAISDNVKILKSLHRVISLSELIHQTFCLEHLAILKKP